MREHDGSIQKAGFKATPSGFDPSRGEPWTGSKKQREVLRAKFGGRCAYCGCVLDKMHADHLEPCIRITRDPCGKPLAASECRMVKPERNTVENMMPACAACNLHKGGYPLEAWRDILQRSAAILRRDTSTFRAGERFGVITASEEPVRFYFEKRADGCELCCDGNGDSWYPMYGVAPHECYWRKGPEFTLGQSTLVAFGPDDCFVPDLEPHEGWDAFVYPSACGTYYCPRCHAGQYADAWNRLIDRIGPPPPAIGMPCAHEKPQALSGEAVAARPEGIAR
jgi:hypothetical protein